MPRPTGLTSAAGALRYWERRQELVANNLANVSTDGFKGDRGFARLVGAGTAGESTTAQSAVDLSAGTLRETHNPLDVALQSDGFFVVQPQGTAGQGAAAERWTRAGSFQLDANHQLVTADGSAVLGTAGPITVPPNTTVSVATDGTVRASGPGGDRPIGQLRIERAPASASLAHDGATRFVPDPGRQSVPPTDRRVRQGFLEESNVTPVGAMVDMIAVQRAYASVQKAVTTIDAVRGLAANELGKPV